jgi:hypothetical protein
MEKDKKDEVVTPAEQPKEEPKEKTADELKAEAEELENKIKTLKESGKDIELRNNYQRRVEKARAKLDELEGNPDKDEETTKPKNEVEVRDLITLGKLDIAEDSEKAEILKKYKAGGLIKTYAEGLSHLGIKAEFDALDAKNTAQTVIDENGSDDERLRTTKEVIANYRTSGELPNNPKAIEAVAQANLKEMGY